MVLNGIYIFGGKDENGLVQNKLRYLKIMLIDNKIVSAENIKLKHSLKKSAASRLQLNGESNQQAFCSLGVVDLAGQDHLDELLVVNVAGRVLLQGPIL